MSAKIGQLRFDEAADHGLPDYRVYARRALVHVERRIRKALKPWFGGRRMASITTADIRAYVAQRQADEAANATINRGILRSSSARTRWPSKAENSFSARTFRCFKRTTSAAGSSSANNSTVSAGTCPRRCCAVATFAYLTGWRTKAKILPMQWHQIDLEAGVVRLDPGTTKNREGRVLVFGGIDELRQVLEAQWAEHKALKEKGTLCPSVFHRDGAADWLGPSRLADRLPAGRLPGSHSALFPPDSGPQPRPRWNS